MKSKTLFLATLLIGLAHVNATFGKKYVPSMADSTIHVKLTDKIQISIADVKPNEMSDEPYTMVEQMPQYPGGQAELLKFIRENLNYPTKAWQEGIQGKVVVRFVITPDGKASNTKVLKSLTPELNQEAIRVIKLTKGWKPGFHNGIAVPVYYTCPIIFKLEENNADVAPKDISSEADEIPQFPGGMKGLLVYINSNLNLDNVKNAIAQKVKGRVQVRFVVDTDGSVKNVCIGKSLHPECDQEAMRIVRSLPRWTPGKLDEKVVAVWQGVPVSFDFSNMEEATISQ